MDNVTRNALGLPRQTRPEPRRLIKVTPIATGVPILISQQRIDRVVQHKNGALIVFADESQMIVAESMDALAGRRHGIS
jgi:hypothetical protein